MTSSWTIPVPFQCYNVDMLIGGVTKKTMNNFLQWHLTVGSQLHNYHSLFTSKIVRVANMVCWKYKGKLVYPSQKHHQWDTITYCDDAKIQEICLQIDVSVPIRMKKSPGWTGQWMFFCFEHQHVYWSFRHFPTSERQSQKRAPWFLQRKDVGDSC